MDIEAIVKAGVNKELDREIVARLNRIAGYCNEINGAKPMYTYNSTYVADKMDAARALFDEIDVLRGNIK